MGYRYFLPTRKAALTMSIVGRKEMKEEVRLFRSMVVDKALDKVSLEEGSMATAE